MTSFGGAVSDNGMAALKLDAFVASIVGSRWATAVGNWFRTGALDGFLYSEILICDVHTLTALHTLQIVFGTSRLTLRFV